MDQFTKNILAERRAQALQKAAMDEQAALCHPEYVDAERNERKLSYEAAMDATKAPLYQQAVEQKNSVLKKLGLDPTPHYTCERCCDTGYANGVLCDCVRSLDVLAVRNRFGVSVDPAVTFDSSNFAVFGEQADLMRTFYDKLRVFCQKFDTTPINNIVLSGDVGTGKTRLAHSIYNELVLQGKSCLCCTAFGLNNLFFENHTSLDKSSLIKTLTQADFLIIDDLGTEPVYRNVTREYLYSVVNERMLYRRRTLITTNLSQAELGERYGERILSRLNHKGMSVFFSLKGNDVRLHKSR